MDYSQTPLWMQDDLVRDIPREKLEFLSTLFAKGHGKSQKEMMSLLMPAIVRKAGASHFYPTGNAGCHHSHQKIQHRSRAAADSKHFTKKQRSKK
ncbi:MAG: hypothetical protein ACLR7F_08385 [Waltera sp.]